MKISDLFYPGSIALNSAPQDKAAALEALVQQHQAAGNLEDIDRYRQDILAPGGPGHDGGRQWRGDPPCQVRRGAAARVGGDDRPLRRRLRRDGWRAGAAALYDRRAG